MSPEDIVFDVANEFLFNDFTAKNPLGAVVVAIATVGFLGVTGPITVPLAWLTDKTEGKGRFNPL